MPVRWQEQLSEGGDCGMHIASLVSTEANGAPVQRRSKHSGPRRLLTVR